MTALSPRLAAVAGYVLTGRPLADIGTDHAYLPVSLIQARAVPSAIAVDILPGPLEMARATVADAGLQDRIQLRLGSGLQPVRPGEAATAAICGMGGPLIAEILAAGPTDGLERLALQPMGGEERLREWLAGHGWRLSDEQLVEDAGRIYVIMAADRGEMRLTETEAAIGPVILRRGGPLLTQYAEGLRSLTEAALAGAHRSDRPEARERAAALERRAQLYEEVIRHAGSDRR